MSLVTFRGFGGLAPKTTATVEELDELELPGGRSLPPSYRDYAENLGYGLTCGFFLISIPMGDHCDSLKVRSRVLSSINRQAVEGDFMDYDPDGSPELVLRLFPFAASENGDVLGWDLEDDDGGEFAIYRVGPRAYGVTKVERSLLEFIGACGDDRVKLLLGQHEPLPQTFKPLVPV